jgi:hypothetical protein
MQREPDRQAPATDRQAKGAEEEKPAAPLANAPAEALRIVSALQARGLTIRLLGGVAIRLRCPHASHRALDRSYPDLDFVAPKKQAWALRDAFVENGYSADRRFNALHGERRLLFYDEVNARQVDIFLSVFEMCHKLTLDQRLSLHPLTLSPADLLLTKLQIVQLNMKDIQDTLALLLDFQPMEITSNAGNDLDMRIISGICAQDWGWFTTVNDNLDRISSEAQGLLDAENAILVTQRVETLKQHIEKVPKSTGWRLRAVVGRRILWYELPEEVRR